MDDDLQLTEAERDEVRRIVATISAEDLTYLRSLTEEQLGILHHTFGRRLRNEFREGRHPQLFMRCHRLDSPADRSYDSISERVMRLVWRYVARMHGE
jgi:hypothetical protein